MIDADLTYDFGDIPRFVDALDDGAELVMGDRMNGIQPGARPWLKYVRNPILSGEEVRVTRAGHASKHREVVADVLPSEEAYAARAGACHR